MKDYKRILQGVVNIINITKKSDIGFANICTYIGENCPELKESEDERIRKAIIEFFELQDDNTTYSFVPKKDIIAWLEKQGEKHIDRELSNLLNRVIRRFINDSNIPYSERDEVSKKIIPYVEQLEKQGEQKPADKIEPKFDIGDTIFNKATNEKFTITGRSLALQYYHDKDHLHEVRFTEQDEWEIYEPVRQKFAKWSKEDILHFRRCLGYIEACAMPRKDDIKWFKALEDRYTWKPSEQEKAALRTAIHIMTRERNFPKLGAQLQNILDVFEGNSRVDWKPNDKQIKALEFVTKSIDDMLRAIGHIDNFTKPRLEEILVALKKLREE